MVGRQRGVVIVTSLCRHSDVSLSFKRKEIFPSVRGRVSRSNNFAELLYAH